jgi:hypothetical protein
MNISVGKIGQTDHDFAKALENKFNDVIEQFITQNNLDKEFDILSVKRDAVFTVNKTINYPKIGSFINFIPKHTYHAYLYIKPYEFYFQSDGKIEVKGLCSDEDGQREKILNLHTNGIINLLNETISVCERTNMNRDAINKFCAEIVSLYKKKELDFDYYREFNIESKFRYISVNGIMLLDNITSNLLDKIDIQFNYKNIILPLVNILC